ncbi:MAG: biotin--[acetyl-CoA-carboxylase] ligase [Bryobacteraceae bacterium]|nr:biotin--[acetyl-CoA-carboxylase] ligase [Bryobacteraceae bacterium]
MIVRLPTTASTMLEAARLADEGAPHLSVVVADEQTAGQGRHGRTWLSPKGGLYCTFVLRLLHPAPIVTLALGLAVAEAVEVPCDLRWPNDVMIGDRKLAGILTALHGDAVLAGIGVNLEDPGWPDAAWLAGVSRDGLLERLRSCVERYAALAPADIIRLFTHASTYAHGRRVEVEGIGLGVTAGLDERGFLLLQRDSGERVTVYAGGVRPA